MRISEVAKLTGITVRTLHYYDEVGLLKPSEITEAGYRLYSREDLEILQQILFFRELDFPLSQIKEIMNNPNYDKEEALKKQKELLIQQRQRIEGLIKLIEKRIEGDTLLYCSDGHLLNIPVNSRWKQGEWWYNRELQISVQDNRMIYVDEHGYLCITELYTEKIVKRERAGKYIYDILYIPAKGVFILADDGVYEVIGI